MDTGGYIEGQIQLGQSKNVWPLQLELIAHLNVVKKLFITFAFFFHIRSRYIKHGTED